MLREIVPQYDWVCAPYHSSWRPGSSLHPNVDQKRWHDPVDTCVLVAPEARYVHLTGVHFQFTYTSRLRDSFVVVAACPACTQS